MELITNISINDWAELSTASRPTGNTVISVATYISRCDLKGSTTVLDNPWICICII